MNQMDLRKPHTILQRNVRLQTMDVPISLKTINVFTNSNHEYGNPVGIVIDEGKNISKEERLNISKETGYSETVYIDNIEKAQVSIYNPQEEVKFAGHALVGTAWYMNHILLSDTKEITSSGITVSTKQDEYSWITAPLDIAPGWNLKQLNSSEEIEMLDVSTLKDCEHTIFWAWIDEANGIVRARTFAPDWGIPEDEANGSGSMLLCNLLQRDIKVIHGKGSEIYTRYLDNGFVEIGGDCVEK
jgi:predicted PhzF superfamily epimerase YddE/YHI9